MAKKKPSIWMPLSELHELLGVLLARDPKVEWKFCHGEGVYSLDFRLSPKAAKEITHEEMDAWHKLGVCSDEDPEGPRERAAKGFFLLLDDTFGREG